MSREKLEKQIKLGIAWFCQWEVPNTELKRNKKFVSGVFMKVKMEANGQCQVVWCFVIMWRCPGVTIASLSMFQQQPGGSLILLDEALIAPTVGFPWLFDHIGLWHVGPVTRCPATSHWGGSVMAERWERTRGGEGARDLGSPVARSEVQSWKFVTCLVWHAIFLRGSKAPSLLVLALFCHPLPPSNWI